MESHYSSQQLSLPYGPPSQPERLSDTEVESIRFRLQLALPRLEETLARLEESQRITPELLKMEFTI